MRAYEIVSYKRKKIVFVDLANKNTGEIVINLLEAQKEITGMPQNSVLILTDARNVVDNNENSIAMKEFSTRISPYVKAYALVGPHGLRAVLLQAAAALTKHSARPFDNRSDAIDWLAECS
ncbi:MAG: hypothetical protein P4L50_09750 [Anaerolineaceae bacterium]|nr:hypothetical protein [Anaerolineaceae bacterium]